MYNVGTERVTRAAVSARVVSAQSDARRAEHTLVCWMLEVQASQNAAHAHIGYTRLQRRSRNFFGPKVAGLKLRESIEIIVGELDKLGVCEESELEFLPDKSLEKLSLTPVSQVKIKKLATMMRESPPAVVQPEPPADRGV